MARELLEPLPASRVQHMTEAAKMFQASLDDEGQEYLEGRGLLGVAPGAGLGRVPADAGPEWQRYVGMLSIPYLTVDREVVSIRFRTMDPEDERPKYLQPSGSETSIYNMPALARNHKTVIITEGELDCLTLEALGYTAIGMPGANSWKPHYSRALDGFQKVIVAGDPDDAGQKFNETIMASIRRSTVMHMKADINDTARQPAGFLEIAEAFARAGGEKEA